VARANGLCRRVEAGLAPNAAAGALREGVSEWQHVLPVLAALRNPDLRERHWAAVGQLLGASMERREGMTLQDVLAQGVGLEGLGGRSGSLALQDLSATSRRPSAPLVLA
jgi:hypothetical protein